MDVAAAAAAQEPELAQLRQQLQAARLANDRPMIDWLTRNAADAHQNAACRFDYLHAGQKLRAYA